MSTFKGILSDPRLSFIALDYFEFTTYHCSVFMLSHVHWDHLSGLFNSAFISLLNKSEDKFFYCSTFTAHLLTKFPKFAISEEKIVAMEVNKSYIICNESLETDIVVTCLAAGHCPGSVMFLIEYLDKRILYTGDFRINVEQLRNVKGRLSNDDGSVIPIDELYLDTTFAFKSVLDDFPPRESSEKLIIDLIERWLKEVGPSLRVFISLPYRFGIEYIYTSLSKRFKKPISVHDFGSYALVDDISSHVVSYEEAEKDTWFIHACMKKKCSMLPDDHVKIIRPCALAFLFKKSKELLTYDSKFGVPFEIVNKICRIFYSSHCSLKELQDIVIYLKPSKIFPNVQSQHMTDTEIVDLIRGTNLNSITGAGDAATFTNVLKDEMNCDSIVLDQSSVEERTILRENNAKKYHLRL